ncbi:hypothetical protein AHAS_Ahas12G0213100 [Arachis hypogaea]
MKPSSRRPSVAPPQDMLRLDSSGLVEILASSQLVCRCITLPASISVSSSSPPCSVSSLRHQRNNNR